VNHGDASLKITVFLAILSLAVISVRAADDANAAFLQGQKLLAGGNSRDALRQYGAASSWRGPTSSICSST